MGFAPPTPGPAPALPGANINVGLPPTPPAVALCGFLFPPTVFFSFGFSLPPIAFPPKLPIPYIALGINCSLSNPLSVNAGLAYGGGRISNADPDPDLLEQAMTA